MLMRLPVIAFSSEDLPTFGRPTIAMTGREAMGRAVVPARSCIMQSVLSIDPQTVIPLLREFQRVVRDRLMQSRASRGLHEVNRATAADTIYQIDTVVDPILEAFCEEWGKTTPLAVVAEGLEDEHGNEGVRVFPHGTREADAKLRLIVDPIDGTR